VFEPEPTPAGFDAVAETYDADEAKNPALAHMRAVAFEHLRRVFAAGSRLLELGSGTGTEAARLVREHRCKLALLDASPRLLDVATRKVRDAGGDGLLGHHVLGAGEVGHLTAEYGRASFDGAYSSLGPLNCEPRLEPVARGLAELVRPGGALVLSIMNRWCLIELAWFVLHGQWREATRRWGGPVQASAYAGGPKDVTTFYYSRGDVERAFRDHFHVEHVEALPLLWPPTYLDFLVTRHDKVFRGLAPMERWAARQPFLRDLGDHVLLCLSRR
jgi:SAM-dependent methyltransferase